MNTTLYKIASNGSVQIWKGWVSGSEVTVEYGKLDGKQIQSTFVAQPTNVGRSNERNSVQQAVFELDALYKAQVDNKHYRPTLEEAHARNNTLIPMKLQNYKDHSTKIKLPCWVQRKFNGSRRTYYNGEFLSKIGRVEVNKIEVLGNELKLLGLDCDGEVYCHGMSLQQIRSASLKTNENTKKLKLVIFDVPNEHLTFEERIESLKMIKLQISDLGLKHLEVELPILINNSEELEEFFNNTIADGYEGIVLRNQGSLFESGKRSYDTQKWKPRYDNEAFCYDVEICKNGDGKLKLRACNELDNVEFTAMMKVSRRDGKSYPRDYQSMVSECKDQWITFSYEELSDKGVPTKPVAECLRKCDLNGSPVE